MAKMIAYYRVSTLRRGRSGLGLAAQRQRISEFVTGTGVLIAEFCEVQSGRDNSRVELGKAIQIAKREQAKIVIARLDRFSRRVSFIEKMTSVGSLRDGVVEFFTE
jgi:DNA invertase Pin-like site-specific DNA recombinase